MELHVNVRRIGIAVTAAALIAVFAAAGGTGPATAATAPWHLPPVRHVFVVNLENEGYDAAFGPSSPAQYLSRTLRQKGQLLDNYYGTAHNSLPNYIAQISGQG